MIPFLCAAVASIVDSNAGSSLSSALQLSTFQTYKLQSYLSSHTGCLEAVNKLSAGLEGYESIGLESDNKMISRLVLRNLIRLRDNTKSSFDLKSSDKLEMSKCISGESKCGTFVKSICRGQDPETIVTIFETTTRGRSFLVFLDTLTYAAWPVFSKETTKRRQMSINDPLADAIRDYLPAVQDQFDAVTKALPKSTSPGIARTITTLSGKISGVVQSTWSDKDTTEKVRFMQKLNSHYQSPINVLMDVASFANLQPNDARLTPGQIASIKNFSLTGDMNDDSREQLDHIGIFVNKDEDPFWYPGVLPLMRAVLRSVVELQV